MIDPRSWTSNRNAFFRAVGTLLALALLVYLLGQQGWSEIGAAIHQIALWRFLAALALILCSRLAVTGRWYVLLKSGGINVSPWRTLRLTLAGLFASNFLPTTIGGDVVRLAGAIQYQLDGAISTASLIVDRLVGLTSMALFLPFGLPALLAWLSSGQNQASFQQAAPALAGFTGLLRLPKIVWKQGSRLTGRLLEALSHWLHQPRALFTSLLFSLLHMLCLFSILTLLLHGMGESISFWLVGGLWSIVYFVTLLPISINGYGVQEISTTLIFSRVGGVSLQSSLTVAVLIRTLLMLGSLPGVAFVPDILAGSRRPAANARPASEAAIPLSKDGQSDG